MRAALFTLALLLGAHAASRAQGQPPAGSEGGRLERVLERAGEAVERYHRGLFSITFTEVLRREELRKDMTAKRSEEFVFETVVVREGLPAGEEDEYYPKSVRRLKAVDGRPPKRGETPTAHFSVASLNFLLPKSRRNFEFSLEGEEQVEGRRAFRVRMVRPGQGEPKVEWKGTNFRVSPPLVYHFWVDAETFEVLRLESRLAAPFEFDSPGAFRAGPFGRFGPSRRLKYVAQDYSVRFRRQQFREPEQTLLVPESAEVLTVIEGAGKPRLRVVLRFSDYRRFRSGVKVVEEPEGQGGRG